MKLRALLIAVALGACGQSAEKAPAPSAPASQAIDPFDLNIEIGRYGVMLNQVGDLTGDRPGSAEARPEQARELARALRETVWEYNLERSRLCAKGLFTEVACLPVYDPVWISEPASAEPTLEDLKTRADALGEEVMRFWNVVCEDARSRAADEDERRHVCAIE